MKAPRAQLKLSYYSGECPIGATRGRDWVYEIKVGFGFLA